MTVKTDTLVAMTEANQNFFKVVRLVDEEGLAVILKNNKPKYVVVGFEKYDEIKKATDARIMKIERVSVLRKKKCSDMMNIEYGVVEDLCLLKKDSQIFYGIAVCCSDKDEGCFSVLEIIGNITSDKERIMELVEFATAWGFHRCIFVM